MATTINGKTYPAGPDNPDGLYYITLNYRGQRTSYGLHDVADDWQTRVGHDPLTFGGVGFRRADAKWLYQNLNPGTIVITTP
jgi:lipoprotein-anchoring transpeptidase ErfK/SrfK